MGMDFYIDIFIGCFFALISLIIYTTKKESKGAKISTLIILFIIIVCIPLYLKEYEDENKIIEVPNVVGKSFDTAIEILKNSGLVYSLTEEINKNSTSGTIIKQYPDAGSQVKKDSQVTLFYNSISDDYFVYKSNDIKKVLVGLFKKNKTSNEYSNNSSSTKMPQDEDTNVNNIDVEDSSHDTNDDGSSYDTNIKDSSYDTSSNDSSYDTISDDSSYDTNSEDSSYITNNEDSSYDTNRDDSLYETNNDDSSYDTNSETNSEYTNNNYDNSTMYEDNIYQIPQDTIVYYYPDIGVNETNDQLYTDFYQKGIDLVSSGNYYEGIAAYLEALKYREDPGIYYNIACTYHLYLFNYEEAINYYLKCLEFGMDKGAVDNISICYAIIGDYDMSEHYANINN